MSIRPIDLQVIVQKSSDVGRNVATDSNQANVAQQTFTQSFQKEVKQMSVQVNQLNKSEQEKVDQNGSGGNKYQAGKRKRRNNEKNDEKEKRKSASTSLFDMTV